MNEIGEVYSTFSGKDYNVTQQRVWTKGDREEWAVTIWIHSTMGDKWLKKWVLHWSCECMFIWRRKRKKTWPQLSREIESNVLFLILVYRSEREGPKGLRDHWLQMNLMSSDFKAKQISKECCYSIYASEIELADKLENNIYENENSWNWECMENSGFTEPIVWRIL